MIVIFKLKGDSDINSLSKNKE